MSVISKDLARQIATKLTEKSRIAAEKLHVEYRELVTHSYEEQTPTEVKSLFKKFADWFYTRGSIRLNGHGFNYEYISSTRNVICNSNNECNLLLTAKVAEKLVSAKRKWEKAKKVYEELKEESKQALLTLKTFNNIRKEIPAAASMLPPPMSNALVVNFESLKKRLDAQKETEKQLIKTN